MTLFNWLVVFGTTTEEELTLTETLVGVGIGIVLGVVITYVLYKMINR